MKWLLMMGLSGLICACASTSTPSNEYLLTDTKLAKVKALSTKASAVQLMPVTMANYLSGNEMVLVTNVGEVYRSKTNLWAESLSSQLTRLTQQRLEKALPNVTWFGGQRLPSYAIAVLNIEVDDFYADLEGVIHISGRWQMISEFGELVASNTFSVNNSLVSDGYIAMVQSLSDTWFNDIVSRMVEDIAHGFKTEISQ